MHRTLQTNEYKKNDINGRMSIYAMKLYQHMTKVLNSLI